MMVSEPSGFTLLTVKNGSLSENTSHLSRLDPLFNKKQKAISIITILTLIFSQTSDKNQGWIILKYT